MENNIIINPYLFYGLIGAIAYLLWLTRWLNKAIQSLAIAYQMNQDLLTESFQMVADDNKKLSDTVERLEDQVEYIAKKENSTS
jgi:hypothetical protein